jgi:hypothetical protein
VGETIGGEMNFEADGPRAQESDEALMEGVDGPEELEKALGGGCVPGSWARAGDGIEETGEACRGRQAIERFGGHNDDSGVGECVGGLVRGEIADAGGRVQELFDGGGHVTGYGRGKWDEPAGIPKRAIWTPRRGIRYARGS